MSRSFTLLIALATLPVAAFTQTAITSGQDSYVQTEPAPIQRSAPAQPSFGPPPRSINRRMPQVSTTRPARGIVVRSLAGNPVTVVAADADRTELRLDRGIANLALDHPEHNEILVDLPGGQIALLKDGFYTFNASTNTVRVLHGEADAFRHVDDRNSISIREREELSLSGNARPVKTERDQARADLLPGAEPRWRESAGYYGDGPVYTGGYYPYGGYPYGLYGYPYASYPYGFGIGFGYFGGFRGYRGGGFRIHR